MRTYAMLRHIIPGVTVNVRLTKGRRQFYFMVEDPVSKVTFKILVGLLDISRQTPLFS
jgi:hypothetical protein